MFRNLSAFNINNSNKFHLLFDNCGVCNYNVVKILKLIIFQEAQTLLRDSSHLQIVGGVLQRFCSMYHITPMVFQETRG